jgi:hypothetical protein
VLFERRRLALLDAFFGSDAFHRAVQERGSLAAAFAAYLLQCGARSPLLPGVVKLEAELARCRRALSAAGGPDYRPPPIPAQGRAHVQRAPGVSVLRVSPDTLATMHAIERFQFEVSLLPAAAALCEDAPRPVLPTPSDAPPLRLGIIPTHTGLTLVELEEALFDLLERVGTGSAAVSDLPPATALSLLEDEVLVPAKTGSC